MGRAGHSARSFCIDGLNLGPKNVAAIGAAVVERWPQNEGLLSTIVNGNVASKDQGD